MVLFAIWTVYWYWKLLTKSKSTSNFLNTRIIRIFSPSKTRMIIAFIVGIVASILALLWPWYEWYCDTILPEPMSTMSKLQREHFGSQTIRAFVAFLGIILLIIALCEWALRKKIKKENRGI